MRGVNIIVLMLVSLLVANTPALGKDKGPTNETPATSGKDITKPEGIAQASYDLSRVSYLRLSCTSDGNSHFQPVTGGLRKTSFAPPAPPVYIGDKVRASRTLFGRFDAGWGTHDLESRLYHPTPAVQFLIILEGEFSITTTDGVTKQFRPGDVLRLEDIKPCKGHITVVGDKPGLTMFIQ
jgi:hypothetical protein